MGHLICVGSVGTLTLKSEAIGLAMFRRSQNLLCTISVLEKDSRLGEELMKAVHELYQGPRIGPICSVSLPDVSELDPTLI
jgi:hypothetical protein